MGTSQPKDWGGTVMLGLKETVVQMAKANGVRWYGHVLRRDDWHVLTTTTTNGLFRSTNIHSYVKLNRSFL